jgi:hypothetical protein
VLQCGPHGEKKFINFTKTCLSAIIMPNAFLIDFLFNLPTDFISTIRNDRKTRNDEAAVVAYYEAFQYAPIRNEERYEEFS